jgi:hypothetical protein
VGLNEWIDFADTPELGTRKRMQTCNPISPILIAHTINRIDDGRQPPEPPSQSSSGIGVARPLALPAQSATQITYALIRLLAPPSLMAACQPVGTPPSENGVGRLHCSMTVAKFTSRMT